MNISIFSLSSESCVFHLCAVRCLQPVDSMILLFLFVGSFVFLNSFRSWLYLRFDMVYCVTIPDLNGCCVPLFI